MAFKTFEQPAHRGLPAYGGGGGGPGGSGDDLTVGGIIWRRFSFSGTATRMEFGLVFLVNIILFVTMVTAVYKLYEGQLREGSFSIVLVCSTIAYTILSSWVSLATNVRRLRDRAWSNSKILWVLIGSSLISAVPIIGLVAVPVWLWVLVESAFLGSKV